MPDDVSGLALSQRMLRLSDTALCAACIAGATGRPHDQVMGAMLMVAATPGRCDGCAEAHLVYRGRLRPR